MSQPDAAPPSAGPTPPNADATLQRILAAVEKDRRRGGLEVVVALVLSFATLASTWCGYQARLWGGQSGGDQSAADTAERQAAENTIVALQIRTQDGLVALEYWRALRENDAATRDNILAHMRPALRAAVLAAIDSGVLTNPELPGPLQRPEYALPEEQEARRHRDEAARLNASARASGAHANSYVLLTLVFASVLFFGGISGTFRLRALRAALAGVSVVLFTGAVAMLLGLPTRLN